MADLANIIWRSLTTSHARLAVGTDRIRRYTRGFPRLVGFADPANPDFPALAPVCEPGEQFMHAGPLREVSGICTLPEYQGRGYARRLTELVVRAQLVRRQTPFLHVASSNTRARTLYERMGFVVDREVPLRVVALSG